MVQGIEQPADLGVLAERAGVIALGPGLGQGRWGQGLFARLVERPGPCLLDADALNLLARDPLRREDWVLTPHPGEAARLLGVGVGEIEDDRYAAAEALRARYGGVCLLKGAGTIICGPGGLAVCAASNPGMASGGMGDALSGIIAALMAQGHAPEQAARLGVCVHARAGDLAAGAGERGLLAGDLIAALRGVVNP
jgi:NAD(P)H-hydrate epimerase